ncbi:AAA family ATPase [Bifidobacterium imperatoris]|uniref:AAA domain-containing protein n=1 Tax=Bifidobacterium imperatoris TaxID=2020965 RepID=A0A2N5IQP8_9BIFI|nr:AAA family ATPase [Bifidobacterium imperatoris]PLS24266.1 AAA domain-containing protein [Bifidobacterium imperatoris]QSY56894.1 AAA family ATPase [Bifidobacterium imperatoris]
MLDQKSAGAAHESPEAADRSDGLVFKLESRADVHVTSLCYIMYPWLVKGGLNVLSGAGGSRKTMWALFVLAQATRGLLKDENGDRVPPMKVLYVHQYEDVPESIIYPRLDMMHADSSKYRLFSMKQRSPIDGSLIPAYPQAEEIKKGLEKAVLEWDPDFIIIDPITLLIDGDTNSRKDVQPALVFCNALAQARRPRAILGIHHWNKAGIFSGSQKFEDTSRSFMDIAVDPTKPESSIVTIGKANNNGKRSMRIISVTRPYTYDDGNVRDIQIIEGMEDSELTVDAIRQIRASGDDTDDVLEQDAWLRDYLGSHGRNGVPRKQVIEEGAKNGFSESQLKHAMNRIGGKSQRVRKAGAGCLWVLPQRQES